jgi:hypothetical protein
MLKLPGKTQYPALIRVLEVVPVVLINYYWLLGKDSGHTKIATTFSR